MSNYINQVSDSLKNHISELANNPCLFLRNPNVDFSRKRKIDFKTFIGIMINSDSWVSYSDRYCYPSSFYA